MIPITPRKLTFSLSTIFALCLAATSAKADTFIVGGSALLSQQQANQLGTWAGGAQQLTNIFSHENGVDNRTSLDFHAAADGRGATYSVLSVTILDGSGQTFLIGGYDPVSWDSFADYHYNFTDAGRTAYLFNFTGGGTYRQDQKLTNDSSCSSCGQYQTYNLAAYGPTFGGGHDINSYSDLNVGYAYNHGYGPGYSANNILNINQYYSQFTINNLEVFTIQQQQDITATPEPATMLLFGTGLLGIAGGLRKRRSRS